MRTGLVTGVALVVATLLWWIVDRRVERPVMPDGAPVAAPPRLDPALSTFDSAELPRDVDARVDASHEAPLVAREPLDAAARPIRGRLLDGHCGPPITSGVRIELSSRNGPVTEVVEPGLDGSFATTRAFSPGRVQLRVLEARSGEELLEKALTFDPTQPVWTVRADLGLVIPLELGIPVESARWARVRVVQDGLAGPNAWGNPPLLGGDRPFLHYRTLIPHGEDATAVRIEVEIVSPRGPRLLEAALLEKTHGVHPVLTVALTEETHVYGRVVDEAGQGVARARVWLLRVAAEPVDTAAIRQQVADEHGAFWIGDLEPGPHALHVALGGQRDRQRVALRNGANDLGTIMVPTADFGWISGSLRDVSTWRSTALVSLTDLATRKRCFARARHGEVGRMDFEFRSVPEGTYEVRPLPMFRVNFEPASRTVAPSSIELEFQAIRRDAGSVVLRVLDGQSREPLENYVVARRIDEAWVGAGMVPGAALPFEAERYVVHARGHGAMILGSAELRATSDAAVSAIEMSLRRQSDALVFVDAEDESAFVDGEFVASVAAPVPGVRVTVDGRTVGTSDADGLALLSVGDDAQGLRFELAGRRAAATSMEEGLRFVWMIRE